MPSNKVPVFEQDDSDIDSQSSDPISEEQGSASTDESDSQPEERRYAQFQDEDDLEDQEDDDDDDQSDSEESTDDDEPEAKSSKRQEKQLREQLKDIPFSALVKARQQLGSDQSEDDSDDIGLSDLSEDEFEADRQRLAASKAGKKKLVEQDQSGDESDELELKRREVRQRLQRLNGGGDEEEAASGWKQDRRARQREDRERQEIEARANKHAPTQVSSRKPVSRKRAVIETNATRVRDPRFDSLSAGAANQDLFAKSYAFLPSVYSDELDMLKKAHAKLKKQEANQAGPKAKSENAIKIREEREKVERALRRAEGLAGERDRRNRETELKRKIKAQNKERTEKGLNPFYLKKSEQKAMLLKDKYDSLTEGASGDKRKTLKKALERRRKKNTAKEKRDMPVGMAGGLGGADMPKRKRDGEQTSQSRPRQDAERPSNGRKRARRGGGGD